MWYYRPVACLTALDLIKKNAIEGLPDHSFPREMPGGKPALLLKEFRNRGLPLGFLEERREVMKYGLLLVECLALPRLSHLLLKHRRKIEKTMFALVLVGGGSNLLGRFSRGYVVGYFSFTSKKLCHLVFNLGDFYIAVGMVVLSATELVRGPRRIGIEEVRYWVIRILPGYVC